MKTDHQGPTPRGQQEPDLPVAPKLGILYDPPRPSQPSLPGATWSGYHSSGPGSGEPIWGRGEMGTQPVPKGRSSAEEKAGAQALTSYKSRVRLAA